MQLKARKSAEALLRLLELKTGWKYNPDQWAWTAFDVSVFSKVITEPLAREYRNAMEKNPLSLAITARTQLQFTVDTNDKFK
jgi:hypothetical protein